MYGGAISEGRCLMLKAAVSGIGPMCASHTSVVVVSQTQGCCCGRFGLACEAGLRLGVVVCTACV